MKTFYMVRTLFLLMVKCVNTADKFTCCSLSTLYEQSRQSQNWHCVCLNMFLRECLLD